MSREVVSACSNGSPRRLGTENLQQLGLLQPSTGHHVGHGPAELRPSQAVNSSSPTKQPIDVEQLYVVEIGHASLLYTLLGSQFDLGRYTPSSRRDGGDHNPGEPRRDPRPRENQHGPNFVVRKFRPRPTLPKSSRITKATRPSPLAKPSILRPPTLTRARCGRIRRAD